MSPLTAVRLVVTTSDKPDALENYTSYTLQNTPFYFKYIFGNTGDVLSRLQILWDFGDGTTFTGPSAMHYYKYPGEYTVKAIFYNTVGTPFLVNLNSSGEQIRLTAKNAVPDLVIVKDLLPEDNLGVYTLPAGKRSDSLQIYRYNSWQNDDFLKKTDYTITLYASGSKSDFMSVSSYYTDKWSHLKTYFGFIETYVTPEGVVSSRLVDSTRTSSTSVFAERFNDTDTLLFYNYQKPGTVFAGTTGSCIEYNVSFVDQKPSTNDNSLIFIQAGLNTAGFLELDSSFLDKHITELSYPYGYINYPNKTTYLKSVFNPAATLAITSNGISTEGTQQIIGSLTGQFIHSFDIYPIKFTNTNIPFVITFKDAEFYTTKCYPPITGYKFDGTEPTELNTVSLGLFKIDEQDPQATFVSISSYRIDDAKFYRNTGVPDYKNSGSYFPGLLNIDRETRTVVICAAALIQDIPVVNVGAAYGFASQQGFKNIKRFTKKPIFLNCDEDLDFSLTGTTETYFTSNTSSVVISISPQKSFSNGNIDRVWIADPDEDKIYVYGISGIRLAAFSLSGLPVFKDNLSVPQENSFLGNLNSASPSNIALDSNGNAWITLYDAVSTIRINAEFQYVDSVAIPSLANQNYTSNSLYIAAKNTLSGYVGENFILPTCVDTDTNNWVWVGYSHPVSSFVTHFTPKGKEFKSVVVDPLHSVQEIIVDKFNRLTVFAKNLTQNNPNAFLNFDKIYKWDSSYNLMSGFPISFNNIGNVAIDLQQNIWVHHDFCKLSRIDQNNNILTFNIGNSNFDSRYYQGIDGIATDSDNYIWILHNYDGRIYYFPISNPSPTPLSALFYSELPGIQLSAFDGSQAFYRAFGDWTGVRWINKYSTVIQPIPRIVRGSSSLFDIVTNSPLINKINENFDATSNYKSYILQESLFNRKELLDNFLGQIVGNIDSIPETLGKTIYEKIANFVSNSSDPEVCNLEALGSLMTQYGLQYYNFATGFPAGLKRSMDLLSINQTKLFGSKNNYCKNFGLSSFAYGLGSNLGDIIPIDTGTFIIGEPIVAYEKFSEKYRLISQTIVPETNGLTPVLGQPYPLSGVNYYWGWGLVTGTRSQSGIEIEPYYIFYKFRPKNLDEMVDGVIDFKNSLTTLRPTASSYQDWVKFGGVMDNILARAMYNGLGMFSLNNTEEMQ